VTGDQTPDLMAIRERLDLVDRRLVQLLLERSRLIEDVIHFKRTHGMPVIDRPREDVMLDHIEHVATSEGLDPRIARQVLRAVIDAFTLLEVEHLGPDP
jgi:isochorismate pyruvate lyase